MHHYRLITHADWGSNPKKRWVATAELVEGHYRLSGPAQLGEVYTFLTRFFGLLPQSAWVMSW